MLAEVLKVTLSSTGYIRMLRVKLLHNAKAASGYACVNLLPANSRVKMDVPVGSKIAFQAKQVYDNYRLDRFRVCK